MKIDTQKFARAIPCLLLVALVIVAPVLPASAATYQIYNDWTLKEQLTTPVWTSVPLDFTSNGVAYTSISYESFNESYQVPVIKYGDNVAIYWRNGVTYYMKPEYRYLDFGFVGTILSGDFLAWFNLNAVSGTITPEKEEADSIKDKVDDASGRLEDANDIWDQIPTPSLSGDELDLLVGNRPEYQQYMNFWQVFWANSTLYEMILVIGALMLASYLIFAGK